MRFIPKKTILIGLIIIIVSLKSFSQDYYNINYDSNNGLPCSEIYHVFQDSKGYIWFCTNQGISKYDGYQFTNFDITNNLSDNTVFEAYEDYKGRIWFTSLSDKIFYYYKNKFHVYAFNDTIDKYRVLSGRDVSKSTFFVDSVDNIYYTWYLGKPLKIDKQGNAEWVEFQSDKGVVLKINENGTILHNYTKPDATPCIHDINDNFIKLDIPQDFYTSLFSHAVATENYLVISSFSSIIVINRKDGTFKKYEFENNIIWLSLDCNNVLWIGMYHTGVKGFKNMNLDTPSFHLMKTYSVSSICRDTEGGCWVTTLNNGAFYFPSLQVMTFTKGVEMKAKSISTICRYNNEIWFAGNSPYIYRFSNKLEEKPLLVGVSEEISKISWFDNKLFISAVVPRTEIIVFDSGKRIKDRFSFFFYKARKSFDENIIFSNSDYYYEYRKGLYKKYFFSDSIIAKNVYDFYEDNDGAKWYATERGLMLEKNKRFYEMADSNALFKNRITCIEKEGGNLWLGTKGAGLIVKSEISIKNYTTKDGLPSNSINDIIIKNDTIWLATNKGLARFVNKPSVSSTEVWSTANGLTNNEVNEIELLNDTVYVATQNGMCYFPQSMSGINKSPPRVFITKIEINNKDTSLLEQYFLTYKQNNINFSFIGINYKQNKSIIYRYRLEGIDTKWNQTEQIEARYSALPPGNYTFQVEAINSSGVISNNDVNVTINIRSPYWQTAWFSILTTFIILALIFFIAFRILKNKIRVYKKQNFLKQELNKFRQKALSAQMNPHFLYNSINSAQYFILNNHPDIASDYLSSLGKLMRIVLNNSVHELIPLDEELNALYLYIEMEQKRFDNSFGFNKTIDCGLNLNKIKVPPLILQPYVENAIHHGLRPAKGDRLLFLAIKNIGNLIIIEIEDNGVGRYQANNLKLIANNQEKHISFGTEITKRRLQILEEIHSKKVNVEIQDLNDVTYNSNGTRVIVTIKQDTEL